MLKNYIDLLKHATDSLMSFGHGSGGSIADYFQAVGLELIIVLLGILYVVGIVLILSLPVWGICLRFKQIDKHSLCVKWDSNFRNYNEFWTTVWRTYESLKGSADASEEKWLELEKQIEGKGISLDGVSRDAWFEEGGPCKFVWAIQDFDGDFPGEFACGFDEEKYNKSLHKRRIAQVVAVLGIVAVYVMLMLPFLFMWL